MWVRAETAKDGAGETSRDLKDLPDQQSIGWEWLFPKEWMKGSVDLQDTPNPA